MSARIILGATAAALGGFGVYELLRRDVNYCSPIVLSGERNTELADCPVLFGLNVCDPNDIATWARRLTQQKEAVRRALADVTDFVEPGQKAAYDVWLGTDPVAQQGQGLTIESFIGELSVEGLSMGALGYGSTAEAVIKAVRQGCGYLEDINAVRRGRRMQSVTVEGIDRSDPRRLRAAAAIAGSIVLLYLGRRY